MRNLSPITRDDDLITQKYAKDNLVFLYAKNIGGGT